MNDHQRTEAQLIEELENLRLHHAALLDSVPDAIITTDLQFTIRGWNRVAQSLYGWHPEEAVGRRMGELVPTSYEDQDSARARAQLIETGHWTGEVRQTKKDGTAVHVHASVSLVKDETGHAFGVVAVNRDVSERRRTESELVRAVREWQTTFDVTNDAIWILDSDERVLRCNETARKLFQRSKDQIVGHFCWSIVHGTSAPIPQCPVSRAKRSLARETMELRIGEQWFEVTADPILDDAGRYAGAVHIISDITERKRAEMALRSNEQRLRTTLYSIGDGVITTDQHGQVQVMNAVAEVLTGWTEREASGRPLDEVFQIVDERTRTPLQNPVSRVLQTGEVLELASHALLISRHGKEHPIADSGAPIRDEGGTVVGVVLVFRDQSHERLRLRVTRARLSLFEFATHHSLDELLTEALDAVGAVVDSPIGFYHFVDSDEKSLLLQQWSTRTVQDFCQATGKGLHYAVESAGVWADAIRTRAPVVHNDYDTLPEKKGMPEGHARVVRELVVPVVVNDRVVAVLGVGNKPTDYTEIDVEVVSHLAEMTWQIVRQKRAEEALRESEERMQAVFASTPDYLMLLDREHKIQLMNRALPGFSHAELHERPLCELASVEDQKRIRAHLDRVVDEATWQHYESVTRGPGKADVHFSTVSAPLIVSGQVVGSVVSSRDISDRVLLESEKRQLEEQYRQSQKIEAVGRLAGGIAHDFNNLLTVINSYASMAAEQLVDGDPLKSDIQEILQAGHRASTLTRQLLAFSRKQVLAPRVLDLNEVVGELEKMLCRLIGEHIELGTFLAEDLGRVSADPSQIEQVLMNLAVNARDAMPDGGKLTIETANIELDEEYASKRPDTRPGRYVMLAVADTGLGMTREVQQRLFEPFFTTKPKGQGTGLGLATVYGIVKQSGGNIWAYSELGIGTTFKIYLPRVEAEKPDRLQDVPSTRLRGNETVLVVEDEKAVRELTKRMLASAGYKVIVAANGGEALLECERTGGSVALVLTDVVMPQMSGKDLVDRLATLCPRLKVLYMSGYTDDTIVHHGVLELSTDFIAKPFSATELLRKVRGVLDGR